MKDMIMLFLKRLILGLAALGFIFFGGSGTQSGSMMAQGGGFVGLTIGIVVLYIFFKMAWRAMGCLPSFIMFGIVVLFILYAIGAFTNGVGNLGPSLKNFAGHSTNLEEEIIDDQSSGEDLIIEEDIEPIIEEAPIEKPIENNISKNQAGAISEFINNLTGQITSEPQEEEMPAFNPQEFPAIYGTPKVINGDTIAIQGSYLKLYGVDAPEANQTCANKQGRSYQCGREAAMWLKSWITGNNIECRIAKKDRKGNMIGICTLGEYDIGAALVNAGWAVADINVADIYLPYQEQAKSNRRGLWQGKFYMPWDWKTLQNKKPKIKVIKPKKRSKGILDL